MAYLKKPGRAASDSVVSPAAQPQHEKPEHQHRRPCEVIQRFTKFLPAVGEKGKDEKQGPGQAEEQTDDETQVAEFFHGEILWLNAVFLFFKILSNVPTRPDCF